MSDKRQLFSATEQWGLLHSDRGLIHAGRSAELECVHLMDGGQQPLKRRTARSKGFTLALPVQIFKKLTFVSTNIFD